MRKKLIAIRALLAATQASLAELPQNGRLWSYTIESIGGGKYLTRTLLPRLPIIDLRPVIHRIWRPDLDRHLHNHPWRTAVFRVVSGGYTEERLVDGEVLRFTYRPGDVNHLDADTFHRIDAIEPDTWTLGLLGPHVQDWGFRVDDALVPHAEYFRRQNHVTVAGAGRS